MTWESPQASRRYGPFVEPSGADNPRWSAVSACRRRWARRMGRVYLGYSPGGRPVTVRSSTELTRDPEFMQRFRREVAAAQTVSDAYTPMVGTGRGQPAWLATTSYPAAAGQLGRPGRATTRGCRVAAGRRLAEALQAIHAKGLVTAIFSLTTFSSPPTGRASSTSASPGRRPPPCSPLPARRFAPPATCRPSRRKATPLAHPATSSRSAACWGSPRPVSRRSAAARCSRSPTGSCRATRTSPASPRRCAR